MALLYPWATKEYLLWNMSLGQVIMYHNLGIDTKYGKTEEGHSDRKLSDMSEEEVRARREELYNLYPECRPKKQEMIDKYGAIE